MRALAHPARLALLEHLARRPDGATATECATVVGLSPSATSYHLRTLAKMGFIREAPSRGDGRERVWQAVHGTYDLDHDPDASTEQIAAETALIEALLARQNDLVRQYLGVIRQESHDWYEASTVSGRTLVVTARELKRVLEQIEELTKPLMMRARPIPPKGARPISFQLRAVPIETEP